MPRQRSRHLYLQVGISQNANLTSLQLLKSLMHCLGNDLSSPATLAFKWISSRARWKECRAAARSTMSDLQTSVDLLFYAALNYFNQTGFAFNRKFYFSSTTAFWAAYSQTSELKHDMMSCSVNPFGNSGRPSPTAGHLHRDLHPFHHKTKYMYNPSYIVTVGLEGAPQSHQCMGDTGLLCLMFQCL